MRGLEDKAHECSFRYFEKNAFEILYYMTLYGGKKAHTQILMLKNWILSVNLSQTLNQT